MTVRGAIGGAHAKLAATSLSPNVAALGCVSMLTAMSSAMIYGLLPVFLVRVIGVGIMSVGLIEGIAEAASSLIKILSGTLSDKIGRRKPFVLFGYTLSAVTKTMFPLADAASTVLVARVADRLGKGIRDAPRDAFVADLTAREIRGTGFGLRLALAIAGFVIGPLVAVAIMTLSGDDFRLVFRIALIPACLSIVLLVVVVKELPLARDGARRPLLRRADLALLPFAFWWTIAVASLLSLARFTPAFLILKAHETGVDAAYVPMALVMMYLVYSLTAYPCGVLADRVSQRVQLGIGAVVLVAADLILSATHAVWWIAVGAALWGLQLGITQGLLAASIADAAAPRLRATAFGIYDVAIGVTAFGASAGAGMLWSLGGSASAFLAGACVASSAGLLLLMRPLATASGAAH
jgi:MFS family permease